MTKQKQATEIIPASEVSIAVRTPEVIAAEIRFIDNQARQYVLKSAIDIGEKLTEAKELVAHGEWGTWLKNNVNYSQSTANNFMRVAAEYANSQSLANLSYTQAVALLAVPSEEREEFAKETNASEMSTRELQAAIKEKQELEKRLKEQEDLAAEQKVKFDQWVAEQNEQREAIYNQYQLELKLRQDQEQQLRDIEQELAKAQADGNNKEMAKLKTELRKAEKAAGQSKDKLATLEEELKRKETEIEKMIAERLEQQKAELLEQAKQQESSYKEQIAKLEQSLQRNNNEAFMKFKIHFNDFAAGFDTLIKALAEIEDEAEKEKLKTALSKAVDKMKATL